MIFVPGKPSDLIERIALLRVIDPSSPLLVAALDHEHDLLRSSGFGGLDSEAFENFVEKLSQLKAKIQDAHARLRTIRHDLYNKAMDPSADADIYRELIRQYKVADEEIVQAKVEIDALVVA